MNNRELYRGAGLSGIDKMLILSFTSPHMVLSTSGVNGGIRRDIRYICNCQVSEPAQHRGYFENIPGIDELAAFFAAKGEVPLSETAFLFTAANMRNAVQKTVRHNELVVASVCTAGAAGNAVRAGDPASYYEANGEFHPPGTINCIIVINKPLEPGTLCRTVITATEGKTAALQELQIPSRYSPSLATGTGTDQIAVASLQSEETALTDAGPHSQLGEMIGTAVRESVLGALELQDGLNAVQRGYTAALMERFGVTESDVIASVAELLQGPEKEMFLHNFQSIQRDGVLSAAVSALIHQFDLLKWGVLPDSCAGESFMNAAAAVSAAAAGNSSFYPEFRKYLNEEPFGIDAGAAESLPPLLYRAIARGIQKRWIS